MTFPPDPDDSGPALLQPFEWELLEPGDEVWVQRQGQVRHPGSVDVITEDSQTFWVWLHQGRGRIVVHWGTNP